VELSNFNSTTLRDWPLRNVFRARKAAFSSSKLMCWVDSWLDHLPLVDLPWHVAPQPSMEASEKIVRSEGGGETGLPWTLRFHQVSSARAWELSVNWQLKLNWWSLRVWISRIWRALRYKGATKMGKWQDSRVPRRPANCLPDIWGWKRALLQTTWTLWTSVSGKWTVIVSEFMTNPRYVIVWVRDRVDFIQFEKAQWLREVTSFELDVDLPPWRRQGEGNYKFQKFVEDLWCWA